jgi:hypothetical protein
MGSLKTLKVTQLFMADIYILKLNGYCHIKLELCVKVKVTLISAHNFRSVIFMSPQFPRDACRSSESKHIIAEIHKRMEVKRRQGCCDLHM